VAKPRNERGQAVTKFCLAMEEHRRTEAGRVRSAKEFVAHFFPHDEQKATDQLFLHMPNDVRGPVLAAWGIRGAKAALKDDDEKVKLVVHDGLVAGDIDDAIFEEGIEPATLVDWIVLSEWWSFWRHGRLTGVAIQKALGTARELGLIDDPWFLLNLQGRGGKLTGTDVLCDTLSKDQIVGWLRKLHDAGDGSPAGLIAAIGWETVLAKTAQDALLFALDQFARKAGLAPESPAETSKPPEEPAATSKPAAAKPAVAAKSAEAARSATAPSAVEGKPSAGASAGAAAAARPPTVEPSTAQHDRLAEAFPTLNAPSDAVAVAEAEALNQKATLERHDSGFPVAIPDMPAVDVGDHDDEPPPSTANGEDEESPKLAEARAAIMQTLKSTGAHEVAREPWDESEIPAKPSSLEWPEPPPITTNGGGSAAADDAIVLGEEDLQKASAPKLAVSNPPPIPKKPGAVPRGR
jgi:hypothetical protein